MSLLNINNIDGPIKVNNSGGFKNELDRDHKPWNTGAFGSGTRRKTSFARIYDTLCAATEVCIFENAWETWFTLRNMAGAVTDMW